MVTMMTVQEYHATLAAQMSEKALELKIRGLLNALNLSQFSFHPPEGLRQNGKGGGYTPGYPDWTIVGRWVMWREVKSQKGRVRPEQKAFIAQLKAAGADIDIWRPNDLFEGRIQRELLAVAGLPANTTIKTLGRGTDDRPTTPRRVTGRRRTVRKAA